MTKYERYTSKDGATLTMSQWGGSPAELELYRKLAELEDKIENGTLVECDVSLLGTQIWTIDKYINGCVDVNIDEQIIIGFVPDAVVVFNITQSFYTEIKNGWWFLTKPEAEAKLKEV